MEVFKLDVVKRDPKVKNPFKKSIKANVISAVIYGDGDNMVVNVPRDKFTKYFHKAYPNTVFHLNIDGQVKKTYIKGYQEDLSKSSNLQHIDFFAFNDDKSIKIKVPVDVVGLAPGIKFGGILEIMNTQITIDSKPADIPDSIQVDVSNLQIGQNIKIKDLGLPESIKVIDVDTKILVACSSSAKAASKADDVDADAEAADETAAPSEEKTEEKA